MPIAILDYGSQYTQLIARRVRAFHVYCQIFPWDEPAENVQAVEPDGFILSGGPASVYTQGAGTLPDYVVRSHRPVLGICYGMQLLAYELGGKVVASDLREYGAAEIQVVRENPLLDENIRNVWMSHGDHVEDPPDGFKVLAASRTCQIAAFGDMESNIYGLQFHPEVLHTENGEQIIQRFLFDLCACQANWTAKAIISDASKNVKEQVGGARVLAAVSGGVDSTVATALVSRVLKGQIDAVFVDTGLLRRGEAHTVQSALAPFLGDRLHVVDASAQFLDALKGIVDPEQKRKVVGETFIHLFEEKARELGETHFLLQGTIYPDVIESSAPDRPKAARIKSHHNVGGLPERMDFELVEPLRYLFKDEVRMIGEQLGLPEAVVWRQPFPGPGLAVRCLGTITRERLEKLRKADNIFCTALREAGRIDRKPTRGKASIAQAFAALLPVRSVGVMGDQRTYGETVVLRAVTSEDFMTADWARLPEDLLSKVSNQIVNTIPGVNRVVLDVTSKPPATIEWE